MSPCELRSISNISIHENVSRVSRSRESFFDGTASNLLRRGQVPPARCASPRSGNSPSRETCTMTAQSMVHASWGVAVIVPRRGRYRCCGNAAFTPRVFHTCSDRVPPVAAVLLFFSRAAPSAAATEVLELRETCARAAPMILVRRHRAGCRHRAGWISSCASVLALAVRTVVPLDSLCRCFESRRDRQTIHKRAAGAALAAVRAARPHHNPFISARCFLCFSCLCA